MDDLVAHMLGEDIELHVELAPDVVPVKADATQMEQVILNLVVNARDAMPEGGELTITTASGISAAEVAACSNAAGGLSGELVPGPYVLLQVRDTGVGM